MEETLSIIADNFRKNEGTVISLLQGVQDAFGYIPQEAIAWLSRELDIPASRFYGVATFYSQFHLNPRGKNIISVCCGTACHVQGSPKIVDQLKRDLGIGEGETTPDRRFTLEIVRCVGACSIAPVVLVNNSAYAGMSPESTSKLVKTIQRNENEE